MGYPEAKWTADEVVRRLGVAPDDMRKFEARSLNASTIGLKFLEPIDSRYSAGGAKANTVAGVIIRMSDEDYPATPYEGTLVIDNRELGRYESESLLVENLSEGVAYYFSAFPYTTADVFNEAASGANRATAIPLKGEIVDVKININDMEEFTSINVTLKNLTDGTEETKRVTAVGTYQFVAKSHEQFKVVVTTLNKYSVNRTESAEFTAAPGASRVEEFNYIYQRDEVIDVSISIDDTVEFSQAILTCVNITDGTNQTKNITAAGTYRFAIPIGKQYKVTLTQVQKYQLDKAEVGPYTAVLAGQRTATFAYTYLRGELITASITIDDMAEFIPVTIKAMNITDGTNETKTLSVAGSVQFVIPPNKQAKVVVTKPDKYEVDKLETAQFTTVLGGTRNFTFAYKYAPAFHVTIEFDNGSDGIPKSFTYKDDCATFTPASADNLGSWANHKILDYFRPCVIKPGARQPEYYLNKNDRTKKLDGTASVLTGNDGDVMTEVGRLYYKVYAAANGRIGLTISDGPGQAGYYAFNEIDGVDQEFMYRGCYELFESGGQGRSISGVTPTVNKTRAAFRSVAKARGAEYAQNDYALIFLWECMYLMLYGTRDSQTGLGKGRSNGSNSSCVQTGTMNTRPWCWGDQGGVNGCIFLGVEHFYGDLWEFTDGITISGDSIYVTRQRSKYSDDTSGYETGPISVAGCTFGQYVKSVQGTKDAIFLPKATGGSETTYFCDMMWKGGVVVEFGGGWNAAGMVGAFYWDLSAAASYAYSLIGSRLCRKKVA